MRERGKKGKKKETKRKKEREKEKKEYHCELVRKVSNCPLINFHIQVEVTEAKSVRGKNFAT